MFGSYRAEAIKLLNAFSYGGRSTSKNAIEQLITCDMLPDDVLLDIFDFYVLGDVRIRIHLKQRTEAWITLAHVSRRWRSIVLQSPLRLSLQLVCAPSTPTANLDIWPPLPLIIRDFDDHWTAKSFFTRDNNIVSALKHSDRVRQIQLKRTKLGYLTNSAAILEPFPELTLLRLTRYTDEKPEPILPDSFLGGSAPRLQSLRLHRVPFPALPKLLLSATHLVKLDLTSIPRSGYIPPEVMATSLSALTGLDFICLRFDYPPPRRVLTRHRPPITCSILPNLTWITFKGTSEYLEVILARIDAPRLDRLHIAFFNQIIFETPQLFQIIGRRSALRAPEKGYIVFSPWNITVRFPSQTSKLFNALDVEILCTNSEWQLSSLEQICSSSLSPVSILENLYISEYIVFGNLDWQDDIENTLWLDLFRPFVAVKNLYITVKFVPRIAPVLQELVGGRTTEVFPALENIILLGFQPSGLLHKGIEKFVAARRLTSRPVAVSR